MDLAGTRRLAALGIASATLLAAALAPAAGAAPGVAANKALTQPVAASSAQAEAGMSIEFTRATATVAGPGALVTVKCEGSGSRSCVGTLSIEAPGEPPEVPFSIDRGEERVVVVPLGEQRSMFDGIISVKTRVTAQTAQPSGESVRTSRTLRFK
ncbi:MAG TPA: hypothetical protein VHR18_07870 [Solirubrobacterales bacterium]|jgi:hypothetical protein|nr:hypothetical protein [Solirubrobacterales bacterium]